jgi:tRNA threonylcarbamoyladenosine biosynthesis protein TsaE
MIARRARPLNESAGRDREGQGPSLHHNPRLHSLGRRRRSAFEWRVYNRLVPVLDANTLDISSHGADQTQRLGSRLGELLQPGDVVCLAGDLGAGKTTLAQGIARGWGALEAATSPTFVLVNEYPRPDGARLYHLDAFRLEADSAPGFDLMELATEGPVLLEWPDRMHGLVPAEHLWVEMRWVEDTRRGIRVRAVGGHYPQLLDRFRRLTFG